MLEIGVGESSLLLELLRLVWEWLFMSRRRSNEVLNPKRVALGMAVHEYAYQRRKIQGVIDYYTKHSNWEIYRNELLQPFILPEELAGWKGDGVVGEIYSKIDAELLCSLGIPLVNTTSSDVAPDVPTVTTDNLAIGQMAAMHLIERNLDRFAFVGPMGLGHVQGRLAGFRQRIRKSGGDCEEILYAPPAKRGLHVSEEIVPPAFLKQAIKKLKLPVGIMASSDRVGFSVLEACRELGLRSPEDVALIGVDNDSIYCELAYATMTSIRPNARRLGFEAAAMLDRLMAGEKPETTRLLIPPYGVVLRNSTDTTRSKYPEVASALRFIRNHAHEFIDVTNVLDVVPVSRRWLEMKFREEVGCGIYQEIRRVHVELAKSLLLTSDLPVTQIYRLSGFNNVERFDVAFRQLVGMGATEFRHKARKGDQRPREGTKILRKRG